MCQKAELKITCVTVSSVFHMMLNVQLQTLEPMCFSSISSLCLSIQ